MMAVAMTVDVGEHRKLRRLGVSLAEVDDVLVAQCPCQILAWCVRESREKYLRTAPLSLIVMSLTEPCCPVGENVL